jgi:hypothetical protein
MSEYKIVVKKPNGKKILGDAGQEGRIILRGLKEMKCDNVDWI